MSTARSTAAPPRGSSGGLPDINAETHSFELVQRLLDQAALLNLYARPEGGEAALTLPGGPSSPVGFDVRCALHRFVVRTSFGTDGAPRAENRLGERLGDLRERWMIVPPGFRALPDLEPPPTPLDASRSQRFVILDCRWNLGHGEDLVLFGTGSTVPGPEGLRVGAVATLLRGGGRFGGRVGTCTYLGALDPEHGFRGNVLCRIPDHGGELRTDREMPPSPGEPLPESGVTWILLAGHKPADHRRTELLTGADGSVQGLRVAQEVRPVEAAAARLPGRSGVRTHLRNGPVVGHLESDIRFDFLHPGAPGTDRSPIPFGAYNRFRFSGDGKGGEAALDGDGSEGRTFNTEVPGAPGQRGLRFGGFGPLLEGRGPLSGVTGLLADNSAVGIAPHATSTLYVLRLDDPQGRFRVGGTPAGTAPEAAGADPFLPVLRRTEDFTPHYREWRRDFRRCSGPIADVLTRVFNARLDVGDFPGLGLDRDVVQRALERRSFPFDEDSFERYRGAAAGTFRTYALEPRDGGHPEVAPAVVLYSVWDPRTDRAGERRFKRITGSFQRYFRPGEVTDPSTGQVDLLVNAHRPDVGVTSFVSIFQHQRQERASIAYKLPGPHEVLWIVKDVAEVGGGPTRDGVYMASHEWKGEMDGRTCYLMVGIHFHIDFDARRVETSGDTFWRALYIEEPGEDGGSGGGLERKGGQTR